MPLPGEWRGWVVAVFTMLLLYHMMSTAPDAASDRQLHFFGRGTLKYASFDDRGVVQVERLPTRPALVKLPRRAFVTLLVSSGTDAAAQASLRTYTDAALTVLHTLSKKNLALLEQQHQAATATHAANTFDAVVLGRALRVLRGPLLIVIDQRRRLIVINRQAITHRGLLIILTLDKRFASDIIFARLFGRIVINVIDAT